MFLYGSKIIKKQKRTYIVKQKEKPITTIFGVSCLFWFNYTGKTFTHGVKPQKGCVLCFQPRFIVQKKSDLNVKSLF